MQHIFNRIEQAFMFRSLFQNRDMPDIREMPQDIIVVRVNEHLCPVQKTSYLPDETVQPAYAPAVQTAAIDLIVENNQVETGIHKYF